MEKKLLHKVIIEALREINVKAVEAADQARATATNKESIAENKYDTFGLEASYLAHGQAKRVAECEIDLNAYLQLQVINFNEDSDIKSGALVQLEDQQGIMQYVFLGPGAGGVKLLFEGMHITLITASSPLGKALMGLTIGDEAVIQSSRYEVLSII